MNEVSKEEMKSITIDGLKYLKRICEKNNITYYLAYGTLLGAVRHKGYIPWDDDIDIWVPRKYYEKLIKAIFKDNDKDWEIACSSINHDYLFEWAKLSNVHTIISPSRFATGYTYGVSIDIFPLDAINNNYTSDEVKTKVSKIRKKFFFITSKYRAITISAKNKYQYMLYKIIFHITSLFLGPYYKQIRRYSENILELGKSDIKYYVCCQTPLPVQFLSEWFDDPIDIEFEGVKYKAPKDYDKVLKTLYNNYMQLPPEDKRISHHFYKVYYRHD